MPSTMFNVINFIAFQIGWFACVLGAARGLPGIGPAVVSLVVAWHLTQASAPRREAVLLIGAAVIGAIYDSSLAALGWIGYSHGVLIDGTAPYWMVTLWIAFATTLNASLAWLKRRMLIAALFGALGGPLAYYGGAKLGALVFVNETAALAALAVGWALLTPVLLALARRYDGFLPTRAPRLQSEPSHV